MKKKLLKGDEGLEVKKTKVFKSKFEFDFTTRKTTAELLETEDKESISSYIISKELVNAVNAAIITGRPLLLKGEPGCGKTKLAKVVAYLFHETDVSKYYFEWHVKSKSKAKDGGYTFDHVSRLQDATIGKNITEDRATIKALKDYITLGPMGYAFTIKKAKNEYPPILLIDEIDKGDIDFPNDLLLELDEMRFKINEWKVSDNFIRADKLNKPLVFITSNDERELPPAFIRRCLYYKIPPFGNEMLEKIVTSKLSSLYETYTIDDKPAVNIAPEEVKAIVQKFLDLKEDTTTIKPPSTSELLDWLQMILYKVNKDKLKVKDIILDEGLQKLALKLMN